MKPQILKRRLIVGVFVFVLFSVLFILSVPMLLSFEPFGRLLLTHINRRTEGEINFSDFSMGWRRGITVSDPAFQSEDGAFTFRAELLSLRPSWKGLLHGRLDARDAVVYSPLVGLDFSNGRAGKKMPGNPSGASSGAEPRFIMPLDSMDLLIVDGGFFVKNAGVADFFAKDISGELKIRPAGAQSSADLALKLYAGIKQPLYVSLAADFVPGGEGRLWHLQGALLDAAADAEWIRVKTGEPVILFKGPDQDGFSFPLVIRGDLNEMAKFAGPSENIKVLGQLSSAALVNVKDTNFGLSVKDSVVTGMSVLYGKEQILKDALMSFDMDAVICRDFERAGIYMNLASGEQTLALAIEGQAASEGFKVEGGGQITYCWNALSEMFESFMPEGVKLSGSRKDGFEFLFLHAGPSGDGLLDSLTGSLSTGFSRLSYMGMEAGPADLTAEIRERVITVKPFESILNSGALILAPKLDLSKDSPVFLLSESHVRGMEISEALAENLLRYLNPLFSGAVSLDGKVDLTALNMSLPLNESYAERAYFEGFFSAEDVILSGSGLAGIILNFLSADSTTALMNVRPSHFRLSEGVLRQSDLQVEISRYPLNIRGDINVASGALDMVVILPFTITGELLKAGAPEDRRLKVPLGGTIDNPELDLSRAVRRETIQEGVIRLIERLF